MAKRTYQQYCPVAEALDVVGERWTLLIVRELLYGPKAYRDLRAALPGMASNLLGDRLSELVELGIVARSETPGAATRATYELTPAGRDLEGVIGSLARWGMRRLPTPEPDTEISPTMAVRAALLAYLRPHAAGGERRVFEISCGPETFTITVADGRGTYVIGPPVRESADLTVVASPAVLMELRLGATSFDGALAAGTIEVAGSDAALAAFRRLFAIDHPVRRSPDLPVAAPAT